MKFVEKDLVGTRTVQCVVGIVGTGTVPSEIGNFEDVLKFIE